MNTHKGYLATAIISVVGMVIILTTLLFMVSKINNTLDQLVENSDNLDIKVSSLFKEETTPSENMFMLKEYNGIIGVFNEYGELTDIIEVDIKSLPRQDQTMLGTGIWATSRQELASLIEDYTG